MTIMLPEPNPTWITMSANPKYFNAQGIYTHTFFLLFNYTPPENIIGVEVTDTASNSSAVNPYQGLESNNSPNYKEGAGSLAFTIQIPQTLVSENPTSFI